MDLETNKGLEKYDGNGWSEVEKLVLYRLESCESNICSVREDMLEFAKIQRQDVEKAREEREGQFKILNSGIQEIRDTYAAAALERAEEGRIKAEQEANIKNEQKVLNDRISRLEKAMYTLLGTAAIFVLTRILEHVL